VVVLLEKHEDQKGLEVAAAVLDADQDVDDIVKDLISNVTIDDKPLALGGPAKKRR